MLTPVDIENKAFKKVKIGGYDINEVENFLEEVIVDYETLYKKCNDAPPPNTMNFNELQDAYRCDELSRENEKLLNENEDLAKENEELREKLKKTEETAEYYNTLEQGVTQTIENSQRAADEIKEEAEKEAERIIEKAKKEAEEITKNASSKSVESVEEIKLEIKEKEFELEKIKKEMQIYKIKVKSMLEAQLKIIDEED